jgi:hypothetical protein
MGQRRSEFPKSRYAIEVPGGLSVLSVLALLLLPVRDIGLRDDCAMLLAAKSLGVDLKPTRPSCSFISIFRRE